MEIVAHRGASADAPENTGCSFKLGFAQHADAIEGDFHLTRDGAVVCMHDASTKRTADKDLILAQSTLAELRQLDIGAWKESRFAGERIATLDEVLKIVPSGKKIFIEIKCGEEIVPGMKRAIETSSLQPDQLRIISFSSDVIADVKKELPGVKAYWLTSYKKDEATGRFSPSVEEVLSTLKRIGADGLDTNANLEVLTPEFVERLRDAKMEFHAWTVDDPDVARQLIKLGVDSITTNKPGWLREQLGLTARDFR